MRMLTLIAAGILIVGLAAACGGDGATPTKGPTATSAPVATPTGVPGAASSTPTGEPGLPPVEEVGLQIKDFPHQSTTVQVGTTVTWLHDGGASHTTTSGAPGATTGLWDSGTMRRGDTLSFRFSEAGEFPFFCKFHPGSMKGTITVVEGLSGVSGTSQPGASESGAEKDDSGGSFDY